MTHIDRLKNENFALLQFDDNTSSQNKRSGRPSGVNEVFGLQSGKKKTKNFHWEWLSPLVKASFPPKVWDEMMGFCRPCVNICGNGTDDDGDIEVGLMKKDDVEVL